MLEAERRRALGRQAERQADARPDATAQGNWLLRLADALIQAAPHDPASDHARRLRLGELNESTWAPWRSEPDPGTPPICFQAEVDFGPRPKDNTWQSLVQSTGAASLRVRYPPSERTP